MNYNAARYEMDCLKDREQRLTEWDIFQMSAPEQALIRAQREFRDAIWCWHTIKDRIKKAHPGFSVYTSPPSGFPELDRTWERVCRAEKTAMNAEGNLLSIWEYQLN